MALIPQALGLEAKDRGVSESAWIVQIASTIIFQKLIHSWKMTIMRSVTYKKGCKKIACISVSNSDIKFVQYSMQN